MDPLVAECLRALGVAVHEKNAFLFFCALLPNYKRHLEKHRLSTYSIDRATVWRRVRCPASVAMYEEFIKVMKSVWELVKDDKVHEMLQDNCRELAQTRLASWLREENKTFFLLMSLFAKDTERFSVFLSEHVGYRCGFATREFSDSVTCVVYKALAPR
jgi:hypothetical protein